QEVAIAVDGGSAASFRWVDQPLHYIKADGAFGRPSPRGDVDRHYTGCFEQRSCQGRQITQTPRRQRVVSAKCLKRIARRDRWRRDERYGHWYGNKLMRRGSERQRSVPSQSDRSELLPLQSQVELPR